MNDIDAGFPGFGMFDLRYFKSPNTDDLVSDSYAQDTWVKISDDRDAYVIASISTQAITQSDQESLFRLEVRDETGTVLFGSGGTIATTGPVMTGIGRFSGVSTGSTRVAGSVAFILPAGWEFRAAESIGDTGSFRRRYWACLL